MSYDISFKVKVEGSKDRYVSVGECSANITWNLREMIVKSTGLEWKNEENNGLCRDIIPHIVDGLSELTKHPDKYKQYEAPNGWGTLGSCKRFFTQIIDDWESFCKYSWTSDLQDVTYFWIE
jgi:hypothetical protein